MEHLVSPGDACFTPSEAKKLIARINRIGGVKVDEIRGVWLHYTHWNDSTSAKVRAPFLPYSLRIGRSVRDQEERSYSRN